MEIVYALEPQLKAEEFSAVLAACSLGERRPIGDLPRLDRMLREADIIATARHDGTLVGIARAVTDYSYCCYLSELAVDEAHQRKGIGKRLIDEVYKVAGTQTSLFLLAAPDAETYYPRIGMKHMPMCFAIQRAS